MIITYARSSSLNQWEYCQNSYFLDYVLGFETTSGHKAKLGTCVHKILESIATIKKYIQDKDIKFGDFEYTSDDGIITDLEVNLDSWMRPKQLSNDKIDAINRTRVNKYKYTYDCKLKYGHIRYGSEFVEKIIDIVYNHYSDQSWKGIDFKDVTNWSWMALEYNRRDFDPRKRQIVAAEPFFDIPIEKDWAKYSYTVDKRDISGIFGIKGTIDLVTDIGDGIYEIIDYKTGSRRNWATNKPKNYRDLQKDAQLMLYYYAAKKMFPEAKQIILTIFFIRDGGPYTLHFDESTIKKMETTLCSKFYEIKECELPTMLDTSQRDFRCSKLCDFFKMSSPDPKLNMCKFIQKELYTIGLDKVVEKYSNKNHDVDTYHSPGEV